MHGRTVKGRTVRGLGMGLALATAAGLAVVHGAKQAPREWRDYAGGPDSSRFVAATQIDKTNVTQLKVAWTFAEGDTDFNPLVVRDVVYTRARGGTIVALDAATGTLKWRSPEIKGFAIRGLNYWESGDGKQRRLFFSALNQLQAVDAATGQLVTTFGKDGKVDLREGLDRDPATVQQQSRLPGRVFGNLIIVGSATNTEYTSAPGDVRAFDVRTGALVWSFRTIPRTGEFGADTWPENARATVGGANNWGELSIDEARGIVYVPTGSGKFNFFGGYRRGDNLFSDSLVALDARTGKRLWHFQTVHHDIWDLDNNSAPQLTTITHDGKRVDIVAMASKTGYLYVFDRVTGAPIWPIVERPVPTKTTVPGQYLSPTQPFPTKPEPFSRQSFTVDDLNPYILTPEEREAFRQRILKARNEGPFTPIGFEEVVHMPGNQGGSNWGSTAGHPTDGRVYVIGFNVPTIIRLLKPGEVRPARANNAEEIVKEGYPTTDGFGLYPTIVKPPYTTLTAYDLNTGAIAWQKGLGDDLRLLPLGITGTGSAATVKGGLIVTGSGLVFATAADRKVHVYDSADGKELATFPLGGPTSGGPSMYEHGGRQYLLVTASATQPTGPGAVPTPHTGPTGLVAWALPR
ncbi:PQQ-binding-like beta-propeller repeat protein [Luteitalea sp. TBR-22]|uniref:outer membrane protein assembly factor BamB family protein n=1 Tax=Luteitalea sp. TBR-22 TaxID=2802971 RepID=UPI001EF51E35|nr:PQQ-binding-like beta-propeller repeat protein [Luteitalea sp. TBR-22]